MEPKPRNRRDHYLPYRILVYLLFGLNRTEGSPEWLESISGRKVRVATGPAARAFRINIDKLWDVLYWLEDNKLVDKIRKGRKRGSAVIILKQPTTFSPQDTADETDDKDDN